MSVEVIRIEKPGPYGVLAGGVWYGIGKRANVTPQDFVVGQTYSVDIWQAESGKKYINKVMSQSGPAAAQGNPPATPPVEGAPVRQPFVAGGRFGTDPDTQERIARNTAYQKATDAASRLLTPYIAKEEDILPKLKAMIEPLADWLYHRIKGEQPQAA